MYFLHTRGSMERHGSRGEAAAGDGEEGDGADQNGRCCISVSCLDSDVDEAEEAQARCYVVADEIQAQGDGSSFHCLGSHVRGAAPHEALGRESHAEIPESAHCAGIRLVGGDSDEQQA